jgi:hypothetical protein
MALRECEIKFHRVEYVLFDSHVTAPHNSEDFEPFLIQFDDHRLRMYNVSKQLAGSIITDFFSYKLCEKTKYLFLVLLLVHSIALKDPLPLLR